MNRPIDRRTFGKWALGGSVASLAGMAGPPPARSADLRELVVAEPVHQLGYLPLYAASAKGYFAAEGIRVKVLTVESGSGHTNAVLTRQAFAFIGGPEHDAFAKAKGAELRAIVNCVNRGNVYLMAAKGTGPTGRDFAGFVRGKRIASWIYGGTPNSVTRYLLAQWGLDPKKDVTLNETAPAAVMASMKTHNADIAVHAEPQITQGVREGIWEQPFFNVPRELGDYAYSVLNVRKESIDNEPELCRGFVRALVKGLKFIQSDHAAALEIARKEFPTMPVEDLTATLDRSFADALWSPDGSISPAAWATAQKVVQAAGMLKTSFPYEQIVDMRFL
jgi:NitT/TauT family transport system substrate-binding protein